MNKSKRIWIIVAAAVVLIAVIVLIWQWNRVGDLLQELDYGQELPPVSVIEPTEQTSIDTTEPSSEETTTGPTEPSSSETETTEPTKTTQETTEPLPTFPPEPPTVTLPPTEQTDSELEEALARIDELIAMVYALKDEYISRLAAIEAAGIAEYRSLPAHEQTPERKEEIAYACVDEAYALEKECDARIDTICAELGYLLQKTNNSQDLVAQIRYLYAAEKTAAKNELMERYSAILG